MDYVASQGERKCVATMPERVMQSKAKNRHKLQLCAASMSEEEQDFVLSMLNEDWIMSLVPMDSFITVSLVAVKAWSPAECVAKGFGNRIWVFFWTTLDVPLEGVGACFPLPYAGLAIHKLLLFFWMRCMSSDDRWFDFCFSNLLFERPELLNVKVSKSILNFVGSIGSATQASV